MEVSGKIVQFLSAKNGTTKKGEPWTMQPFIIETTEKYPKKIAIDAWGDSVNQVTQYRIGTEVKVSVNLESREFNGKWNTNVKAWRIDAAGATASAPQQPQPQQTPDKEGDDLPF